MRRIIFTTGFKTAKIAGLHGRDTAKAWAEYRFAYWQRYTKRSILNQTNPDWIYWFIVDQMSMELIGDDLERIQDDRFKLVYRNKQIEALVNAQGDYTHYLVFRLDSDDMYHKEVVNDAAHTDIQDCVYIQYLRGYIYKPRTRCLKQWWRKHDSPPFFAMVYPSEIWNKKIVSGDGEIFHGGHEKARLHRRKILGEGRFCVGVHDLNTSTTIGKRPEVTDEDSKIKILSDFGIQYPESDFLECDIHNLLGFLPGGWEKTKEE